MSAIKIISEYIGENENRTATVYKDLADNNYMVSVKNEAGSSFIAMFDNIDEAEDYAESWVMNK